jgi:acyl-CoA synthetase (AMP-forming)/AMP-acid ligase II
MADWLVHHELEKQARWRGDDLAFVFEDAQYTYAAFEHRVTRLAIALRDAGVGPGDRVLVHAHNHCDLYALFFACSKAGAVFCPVSKFQSPANLRYICDRLDPVLLFYTTEPEPFPTLAALREHAGVPGVCLDPDPQGDDPTIETFLTDASGSPPDDSARSATEDHNVFWTSGTTGRPKAVVRDHRSSLGFAAPLLSTFPFERANRRLGTNDMTFAAPYLQYGLPTVMTGGLTVVLRRFDPATVCDRIETWDISAMLLVFSQASLLVEHVNDNDFDVTIDAVHAVLPSARAARSLSGIADELYHLYASTEIGLPLVTRVEAPFEGPPALGTPGVGVDLRLVPVGGDPTDAPERYTPGDQGEVYCRGVTTMTRYMDDSHQARVVEGWVPTGDVLRVTETGELAFVGRADNRIRSGGINVHPESLERTLTEHPDVEEAVIVGVPDEKWGERICALVVLADSAGDTDALRASLDAFCRDHEDVADAMRPRSYAFVDSVEAVPTSAVGKVDRRAVVSRHFQP